MANIIDYIKWRGDLTFKADKFNEIDALIFSQLAYITFGDIVSEDFSEEISLEEAGKKYLEIEDAKSPKDITDIMVRCNNILREAVKSERFKDLKLVGYSDKYDPDTAMQFGAITIKLSEGRYFVAFRGTDDTIAGWQEDFKLCYMTPVASQSEAQAYLARAMEVLPGKFYIGGHSKGGNLSVYSALYQPVTYKHKIKRIYNFDGPGFLIGIVKAPEYKGISHKIKAFMPQGSIVGMIMYHSEEYNIVHSDEKGISQHNVTSWQIMGKSFEYDEKMQPGSIIFNNACKKWVSEISGEERETFITIVFQIIKGDENETVSDITSNKIRGVNKILKSYNELEKDNKKKVKNVVRQMIKLGMISMNENETAANTPDI